MTIDHLIHNPFAVLGIDVREFGSGKTFLDALSRTMQTLTSDPSTSYQLMCPAERMLALISIPLAPLLLLRIFMGQAQCFQVHMNAVVRDADLIQLSDHLSRPEPIARMHSLGDFCFPPDIGLPGTVKILTKSRFLAYKRFSCDMSSMQPTIIELTYPSMRHRLRTSVYRTCLLSFLMPSFALMAHAHWRLISGVFGIWLNCRL